MAKTSKQNNQEKKKTTDKKSQRADKDFSQLLSTKYNNNTFKYNITISQFIKCQLLQVLLVLQHKMIKDKVFDNGQVRTLAKFLEEAGVQVHF